MPTPLGPWDPAAVHREARDPGPSHLDWATSFYTTWSQVNELFSVKTSEVFDAGSAAFESLFYAPPPAPPPPPRPRSAPFWNLSATVPEERAEHNSLMHWTNSASLVAKAGMVPTPKDSSLSRKKPDATLEGDDSSEVCGAMFEPQPTEEPAHYDLSNLRVYGSIPGMPVSFTISEYNELVPPFSPASTVCYARQAPVSPASTVYCHGRQAPVSPASTTYLYGQEPPAHNSGQEAPSSPASTVCNFQAFEAPLPEYDGGKVLPREPCDFPLGIAVDDSRGCMPIHPTWRHFSQDRGRSGTRKNCGEECSSQWCGLFNACSCCPDSVPESCSRCQQALGSFLDHHCPNCSKALCVKCIENLNGQPFCCTCGDEEANKAMVERRLWMLGAKRSATKAFAFFLGTDLAGATETHAAPQPRTYSSTKEAPLPAGPLPPSLPYVLGHRRRASQATEVFKTYLPGEMPCSPMAR
ncbi:NNT [Symbiodinium sp. CCMP2592]|nr:NNT [Symbiodinium sp. CCMP2592]